MVKRVLWTTGLGAAALAGLALSGLPALAHHSSAPFYDDTKEVEALGTVSEFVFRNPHSFLFIDGQNQAGEAVRWEVELGAAVTMQRRGWTPETIVAGAPIRAVGNPSRAPDTYGICCAELTNPDGSRIRP